jgi:hypothetical protein
MRQEYTPALLSWTLAHCAEKLSRASLRVSACNNALSNWLAVDFDQRSIDSAVTLSVRLICGVGNDNREA